MRVRPKPLRNPQPRLLDIKVPEVAVKIDACLASGVELSLFERRFLSDFQRIRRKSPQLWRSFWRLCARCGIEP
jgi:hypothetical protein